MDDKQRGQWWWLGCLVWPVHVLSVILGIPKLGDQPEGSPESFCPTRRTKQGSWTDWSVLRTSVSTRSSSGTMQPTRCLLQIATSSTGTNCILKNNWITPDVVAYFVFEGRLKAARCTGMGRFKYLIHKVSHNIVIINNENRKMCDKLLMLLCLRAEEPNRLWRVFRLLISFMA